MNIEVILTADDSKLGKKGQVIKVSSGFAQNCLFPQQRAKPATPANLKFYELQKARTVKEEAEKLSRAKAVAEKIAQTAAVMEVMTGHPETKGEDSSHEPEKLFGSVTAAEIVRVLGTYGVEIDKKEIQLEEPIKRLGDYKVTIKLHREVTAVLRLSVVKKTG